MGILRSTTTVSSWTFISRISGFARDLVLANKLGTSSTTDAFFIALTLPNLFRRLFAEGAFNFAFLPLYKEINTDDPHRGQHFVNTTFTWLFLILIGFTLLAEIFMPALVTLMAPGFLSNPEKFAQTVFFARITFPYLTFISIASLMGSLCNSVGRFAAFAAAPVLLNLSLIGCLIFHPAMGLTPGMAATIAVPLGGILQVTMMLYFFKRAGLRLAFGPLKAMRKERLTLWKRFLPATLGVGILQISFLIDTVLASLLYEEAVSYLQFANRFYQMPLALIGTALATVLLPHFADALHKKETKQIQNSFNTALVGGMTLAFAATVGLVVLSQNLIATLLEHGEFTAAATQGVAWAMVGYSIGLPGYILTKITATAFFAMGDTKTPVKTALFSLGVNAIANLILMQYFGHVGIALATAISGYTNAALQWYYLKQKDVKFTALADFPALIKQSVPTAITMAIALLAYQWFVSYPSQTLLQLLWLTTAIALGGVIFVTFNRHFFLNALRKAKTRKAK